MDRFFEFVVMVVLTGIGTILVFIIFVELMKNG